MTAQPLSEGLSASVRIVKAYLEAEITEDGFLSDLKTLKTTNKSDIPTDPPAVWIHQHPTVTDERGSPNLSNTQYLMTPFEFICIEYDNDPLIAAAKAQNLATRVGASILKNFNRVKSEPDDPDRMFQNVRFNTFIPDGEVEIEAKKLSVPATSIIFDFVYPIVWEYCRKI